MHPLKASLLGSREVSFTIISISISLVAVFIPIFFLPGPLGLLFREFAVLVSLSILVSAVVSLTLVPMLCSRFLPKHGQAVAKEAPITIKFERYFTQVLNAYEKALDWALTNQKKVLQGALATFVITIGLFILSPKGFFPEEDTGQLFVTTEAADDISFNAMVELQNKAADIVRNNENIEGLVSIIGGGLFCWISLEIPPVTFVQRLQEVIPLTDLWVGLLKAPVFGAIIAMTGCFQGMQVSGNAEEVGLKTTAAVVQAIFLVIVLDAFFAVFFTQIGWI
jgi:multidrug efflux pump subunit AcrB